VLVADPEGGDALCDDQMPSTTPALLAAILDCNCIREQKSRRHESPAFVIKLVNFSGSREGEAERAAISALEL
jgi:hypothetical protein